MNGTLNKVILIGHLGDEVKMHYFDAQSCIGRFPLATNEVYINKSTGEKITSTEWHNIVLWNNNAERLIEGKKGDMVYVEGRITYSETENQQTNKVYIKANISADTVVLIK